MIMYSMSEENIINKARGIARTIFQKNNYYWPENYEDGNSFKIQEHGVWILDSAGDEDFFIRKDWITEKEDWRSVLFKREML